MDKILVLGATGNIGMPLIEYLTAHSQATIVAGVHNVEREQDLFNRFPRVTVAHFDFLDPATFPAAFAGVNKVFFVRPPQLAKPKEDMLPFLKYAQQQQIQQIVFVSLIGVEKNPMTPHHLIEQLINDLKLPYTFIRPSFFMQNLNTTHQADIRDHHDLFIPAGNSRTSFIDTRDIGEVAGIALLDPQYLNQKLDITGPTALTYHEVATIMSEVLGVTITYSKPSLLKFRHTLLKRGMKKDYVNVMVLLYLITQLGLAKQVNHEAEKILKRPPCDFRTYIADYRDCFKA